MTSLYAFVTQITLCHQGLIVSKHKGKLLTSIIIIIIIIILCLKEFPCLPIEIALPSLTCTKYSAYHVGIMTSTFIIPGTSPSQEHLTIFNISEGTRATFSVTLVGIREFYPSSLTHPLLRGSKVGGFSLKACLHMATYLPVSPSTFP